MSSSPKRHLQALPERRRGVALIRVSKEREGMVSPENQRYAIEQYAERANIDVTLWVEGIDESGSRKKSAWWPRLDLAIATIEKGDADVLLVWRIDRTARNRLKWAIATDRVESAGGYIESATEPNDRSPAGRFSRGLMAEHAAFMAESIGATWKETLERRVRHGLTPNGARHFGYEYLPSKTYAVDPIEGPILADMYRSYIAGESAQTIAKRYTNPNATPQADGTYARYARWNTPAVLRLLDSGFGAGFILYNNELHPGVHEPVITADEWARFRHTRAERRRRPRAERSPYTFSGMIYCHCGSRMSGRTDHGVRRYACTRTLNYERHPDASIAEHLIDAAMVKWLGGYRDELNNAARNAPRTPRIVEDPRAEIQRRMGAVNTRLDAAAEQLVAGVLPRDSYERLRDKYTAERDTLARELDRVEAQQTVQPVAFIGDLVERWLDAPVPARREALRLLIDRVNIGTKSSAHRVIIKPHGNRS